MKLARKLKINDLTPVDFTEYEINLIKFIDGVIGNYDIFNSNESGLKDRIFFMDIGGHCILDYSHKEKHLYVKGMWIWESLERDELIMNDDLFDYLKWRIAKSLKVKIKTISYDNRDKGEIQLIEDMFKTSDTYLKKREGISKLTYLDFLNNEDK